MEPCMRRGHAGGWVPSSLPWLSGGSEQACSRGGSPTSPGLPPLLTKDPPREGAGKAHETRTGLFQAPPLNPSTAGPASSQSTPPPAAVPQEGRGLI